MAKTKTSTKRADHDTKAALKGLKSELKRLGKAVSKQLRASAEAARHADSGGESVATAAQRTKSTGKKAAKAVSKSAKAHTGAGAKS